MPEITKETVTAERKRWVEDAQTNYQFAREMLEFWHKQVETEAAHLEWCKQALAEAEAS